MSRSLATRQAAQPAEAAWYFDFQRFSRDIHAFCDRSGIHDVERPHGGRNGASVRSRVGRVAEITGLSREQVRYALAGTQVHLRVICVLADWADLSLDAYHVREFGANTPHRVTERPRNAPERREPPSRSGVQWVDDADLTDEERDEWSAEGVTRALEHELGHRIRPPRIAREL